MVIIVAVERIGLVEAEQPRGWIGGDHRGSIVGAAVGWCRRWENSITWVKFEGMER